KSTEEEGKKRYELTDEGRAWLTEHAPAGGRGERGPGGPPWGRPFGGFGDFGAIGDLRRLGGELFGQLRQIGRFGSPAQQEQAKAIRARARDELYAVLAQPREQDAPDAPGAPGSAESAEGDTQA